MHKKHTFASYTRGVTASQRRALRDIVLICVRSVGSLSNGIIFVVLGLLFYLGEVQTAFFLSLAIFGGILIGVINDIRARVALERLQMLTTPIFIRLTAGGMEEKVLAEALQVGDRIKLVLGDQVPCDSTLASAQNLEISQALLTGESDSFPKKEGEKIHAGDIIVAGTGVAIITTTFADSELSKMTSSIKRYSVNLSPIEQSIQTVISYSGYGILVLLAFVVGRGYLVDEPYTQIVQNAAALTSTLVPQGLIVAVTILFAYGAIRLYQDKVLLQDVNATEKLGRIKNLCIDKTGTLTENVPTVAALHVFKEHGEREALQCATDYIKGSGDSSQTARAIERFAHQEAQGEVVGAVPFTSQRQFGAVEVRRGEETFALVMGGPDVLLRAMSEGNGKLWAEGIVASTKKNARLVCLARADVRVVPSTLVGVSLTPVAMFELESRLRGGVQDIISFFQARGVRVRVISGDNPETVSAIALEAGIIGAAHTITGADIEGWSEADFASKLDRYTVFARIQPALKERLIDQFSAQGFTAMVGDGANDALAIKKSNLGIAMFEGATATRQLAGVVLMDNSFAALPKGIQMADTIIGNVTIISSLYLFEMGLGLILFLGETLCGSAYTISPQNMILINYVTVGFPGFLTFFWTMRGIDRVRITNRPFLSFVTPFAAYSSVVAGVLALVLFVLSRMVPGTGLTNSALLLGFVGMSLVFFCAAPSVYTVQSRRRQLLSMSVFVLGTLAALEVVYLIPLLRLFFALAVPTGLDVAAAVATSTLFGAATYILVRRSVSEGPAVYGK